MSKNQHVALVRPQATARRNAARANSRVESNTGNGHEVCVNSNGSSVHTRATAVQPSPFHLWTASFT